jgi:hypothetical protein
MGWFPPTPSTSINHYVLRHFFDQSHQRHFGKLKMQCHFGQMAERKNLWDKEIYF